MLGEDVSGIDGLTPLGNELRELSRIGLMEPALDHPVEEQHVFP